MNVQTAVIFIGSMVAVGIVTYFIMLYVLDRFKKDKEHDETQEQVNSIPPITKPASSTRRNATNHHTRTIGGAHDDEMEDVLDDVLTVAIASEMFTENNVSEDVPMPASEDEIVASDELSVSSYVPPTDCSSREQSYEDSYQECQSIPDTHSSDSYESSYSGSSSSDSGSSDSGGGCD